MSNQFLLLKFSLSTGSSQEPIIIRFRLSLFLYHLRHCRVNALIKSFVLAISFFLGSAYALTNLLARNFKQLETFP